MRHAALQQGQQQTALRLGRRGVAEVVQKLLGAAKRLQQPGVHPAELPAAAVRGARHSPRQRRPRPAAAAAAAADRAAALGCEPPLNAAQGA